MTETINIRGRKFRIEENELIPIGGDDMEYYLKTNFQDINHGISVIMAMLMKLSQHVDDIHKKLVET